MALVNENHSPTAILERTTSPLWRERDFKVLLGTEFAHHWSDDPKFVSQENRRATKAIVRALDLSGKRRRSTASADGVPTSGLTNPLTATTYALAAASVRAMQPREYLRRVATSWWNVVTALGAALAILSGVSGVHTPWWLWLALIIGGLLLAQYQTFQRAGVRSSIAAAAHLEPFVEGHPDSTAAAPAESGATESAGTEAQQRAVQSSPPAARAEAEAERTELEPMWLQGQIYPYMYSPVVDANEKALTTRVAITVQMPAKPEVGIGSSDQQALEDAVADSSFERWILEETTVLGRPGYEHFWRHVDPTRSSIVTLKRPPAAMVPEGWTLDARAVLNLQPTQVPQLTGWMRLHLDSVIRSTDAILDRHRPLSLQEFFEQLYVMLSALLDEIGPAIVPRIVARPAYEPLSVGAVVIPSASMFNDYFPLGGRGWQRAEGSGDVPGAEWYPTVREEVDDATRRAASIRTWMTKIVRDSGFVRGYERDIELLQPPTV